MIKAEVKKKDGTHITIEGSEDEVKRVLALIQFPNPEKGQKMEREKAKTSKMSIPDMLHELKEEGFFDKPKSLIEIKNALEERGRIYKITTLSTQVIRQVRKRNLGRIRQENKWMYQR